MAAIWHRCASSSARSSVTVASSCRFAAAVSSACGVRGGDGVGGAAAGSAASTADSVCGEDVPLADAPGSPTAAASARGVPLTGAVGESGGSPLRSGDCAHLRSTADRRVRGLPGGPSGDVWRGDVRCAARRAMFFVSVRLAARKRLSSACLARMVASIVAPPSATGTLGLALPSGLPSGESGMAVRAGARV